MSRGVTDDNKTCDVLILGGGLSGGLIALALAAKCPALSVTIIDADETLGGNHIWSFFASDVADADRWLVEPLIERSWPRHEVRFPEYTRIIEQSYCSITSEQLDAAVRAALSPERIITGEVIAASPTSASLADGREFSAHHLIDARGAGDLSTLDIGYQKFVGQMLEVCGGHGLAHPIIMDATVDQADGYRFVYCLPFSPTEVFVEDTYYTNGAALDVPAITARIGNYAANQGWEVGSVGRTETGILPVAIGGDFDAYWASSRANIAKAGVRAGLFHAMTGYSLPDAVRFASAIPHMIDAADTDLSATLRSRARAHWRSQSYYRLLGKMLFRAAAPADRFKIFQRFYKLDPQLIARFYAGQSLSRDRLRILMGKPPVPIIRALAALIRRR